jgi:predicted RNase H-like HicB family nuclease
MTDYHINIFYSEPDKGYIAEIPDLSLCSAFGKTASEALAQLEIARAAWFDAARAEGRPIPEPRYSSGKFASHQTRKVRSDKLQER